MAVFSRMQCPRKVYQLNLPGSRETSTDFLVNTPWSQMPLCKFLKKIPTKPVSGHQTTCVSGDELCKGDVCS